MEDEGWRMRMRRDEGEMKEEDEEGWRMRRDERRMERRRDWGGGGGLEG